MSEEIEYRHISLGEFETRLGSNDDGTFSGYANLHEVVDSHGTHFAPGAWTSGGLEGKRALLFMHNPDNPVGVFEAREDETGLHITGRYDPTPEGMAARARAKSGSAPELSVGFVRRSVDADDENRITSAELHEVSQITLGFASQPGAELMAVRKAAEIMEKMDEGEERVETTNIETREIDAPDGSYESIIDTLEDAAEAWAASNGAGQDACAHGYATFPDHVIVAIYETPEDDDGTTYSFPYVFGANEAVTLGEPTKVELMTAVEPADADDGDSGTLAADVELEKRERDAKRAAALLKLA